MASTSASTRNRSASRASKSKSSNNSSAQKRTIRVRASRKTTRDHDVTGAAPRNARRSRRPQQKQQVQLLVGGFCRKFSTLTKKYFESSLKSCSRVAFSVAWLKFLSNFQYGKTTQGRMILDGLLKKLKESFSPGSVHCVMSVLHESVYTIIHKHERL